MVFLSVTLYGMVASNFTSPKEKLAMSSTGGEKGQGGIGGALRKLLGIEAKKHQQQQSHTLVFEKLQDKFDYFLVASVRAREGEEAAKKCQRLLALERKLATELRGLTSLQVTKLGEEMAKLESTLNSLHAERVELQASLRKAAVAIQNESADVASTTTTTTTPTQPQQKTASDVRKKEETQRSEREKMVTTLKKKIEENASKEMETELALFRALATVLTAEQLAVLEKNNLCADAKQTLSMLTNASNNRPQIYHLQFNGDIMATQVKKLREEITAILQVAKKERGDQVVLSLNSGGGTVTGYGLGAAQLERIKEADIPLTVCVDEVAASGGYMMACVADRVIAAPFSVLGSIGVVASVFNFADRLEREGLAVEDVTAGKYKRTMTPYKKPSPEDRQKVQDDLNSVLSEFKHHVSKHRPKIDIEQVATGETWYGQDSLKLNLVDELATVDDVLFELSQGKRASPHLARSSSSNDKAAQAATSAIRADVYRVDLKKNNSRNALDALLSSGNESNEGQQMLLEVAKMVFAWMAKKVFEEPTY